MSLFQTKEWWAAPTEPGEEFGNNAVAVGNLDNDPSGALKVATGSFSGMLRIYSPNARGYKLEDLVLESALELPILQLEAGRLVADPKRVALAVLHPRRLSVYTLRVSAEGGVLSKAYEHTLDRPACNLCQGPFGGHGAHEFLAVQSMDGSISIFEQDRAQPPRHLSKFLLPGPLAYCAKNDSLLTFNSQLEVDCYRYSSLSSGAAAGGGSSERMTPEWHFTVGEHVHTILVARVSRSRAASQVDIVVLAERLLIFLKENGAVRDQRRLDYSACCCRAFTPAFTPGGGARQDQLLIGSRTGSLLIYRDMELLWSARLPSPAASLGFGSFGGQPGLILCHGTDGGLRLCYLGTAQAEGVVSAEGKELNYEAMDAEHRKLLSVIRDTSSAAKKEPTDGVTLWAQVPHVCDAKEYPDDPPALTLTLYISHSGAAPLGPVSLAASCAPPLYLNTDAVVIPSLPPGRAGTPVPFTFRASAEQLPIDLAAHFVASYTAVGGEARCARCAVQLPLSLVAVPIPPVKSPGFKVTIEINRPPPPLRGLFEDLLAAADPAIADAVGASGGTPALSLQYHCGLDSTVLASKNSGKYRIQSNAFEGLWLLTDELLRRLQAYFGSAAGGGGGGGDPPFAVSFQDALPLHEYFEAIDEHLRCRHVTADIADALEKRAHQFRVVEKRLLVRLKDRNPVPLSNLELLLSGTYDQLMELARGAEAAQQQLAFHATRLSAGTRLLLLLLSLKFGLSRDETATLHAHLSPIVLGAHDQGWEELTYASLTYLLRTALAKPGKEEPVASSSLQTLSRPSDAAKLKKNITLVCDRLSKGMRPREPQDDA